MKTKIRFRLLLFLIPLFMIQACGQTLNTKNDSQTTSNMENLISKPENPYYSNTDKIKLNVSDAE